MELLQLKYFCESAMFQSFSKTAKKYGVPQSDISKTIRRLEKELNVDLFTRTPNRIILNDNGKMFYEKVSKALYLIESGNTQLKNKQKEIRMLILANRRIVTNALELFLKNNPNINITLDHQITQNGKEYDLIISDNIEQYKSYYSKLIVEETMSVAFPDNHRFALLDKIDINELKNEHLITMQENSELYKKTEMFCKSAGFEPNFTIKCSDPYYVRKYVSLGMGIAVFPTVSWQGQFSDNVMFKPIKDTIRKTYVFWKNSQLPLHINDFINLLTKEKEVSLMGGFT